MYQIVDVPIGVNLLASFLETFGNHPLGPYPTVDCSTIWHVFNFKCWRSLVQIYRSSWKILPIGNQRLLQKIMESTDHMFLHWVGETILSDPGCNNGWSRSLATTFVGELRYRIHYIHFMETSGLEKSVNWSGCGRIVSCPIRSVLDIIILKRRIVGYQGWKKCRMYALVPDHLAEHCSVSSPSITILPALKAGHSK